MKNTFFGIMCVVICGIGSFFASTWIIQACATSSDFRDFADSQQKGDLQIAAALHDLSTGVVTPLEAEDIVTKAVAKKNAETDEKVKSIEERILSWWQVAMAAAMSSMPVVYAGMRLLNNSRNRTRIDTIEMVVERKLAEKGMT